MLNSDSLRSILKEVFDIDDKYLIPISTNWFLPTVNPGENIGDCIGYRIINKVPIARAYQSSVYMEKSVRVTFRLTFIGPHAEEIANQTLLWDDRTDVVQAFAKHKAQLNYTDRTMFTYPVRNGGFNDELCWIVDMSAQTFYEVDTNQKPWILRD